MSRIGKQPVTVPQGVRVVQQENRLSVTGPRGVLECVLHGHVTITQQDGTLQVSVVDSEDKRDRSLWGLWQRLISNMVKGVSEGFEKKLELQGVGYRVAPSAKGLTLNIGFSHSVEFELPLGVQALVEKNIIILKGIDKQLIGETAARIRALRKPEPYKGKGIRYVGEVVRRKAGKAGKAGAK